MYKLVVLSGASGIGKSSLIYRLKNEGLCEIAPKYSERLKRKDDDEIIHIDNIYNEEIDCDIIYEMYNTKYGINTSQIREKLKSQNQIIIISNIESLKSLRHILDDKVITVYISLLDSSISKLIETYIYREEIKMELNEIEKLKSLLLSISLHIEYESNESLTEYDIEFKQKMKKYFDSNREFEIFLKRYESWTFSKKIYNKNKNLFNYFFIDIDSAFVGIKEIIENLDMKSNLNL